MEPKGHDQVSRLIWCIQETLPDGMAVEMMRQAGQFIDEMSAGLARALHAAIEWQAAQREVLERALETARAMARRKGN